MPSLKHLITRQEAEYAKARLSLRKGFFDGRDFWIKEAQKTQKEIDTIKKTESV